MLQNIGTPEIIILVLILLVVFGSKKIVELAGSLGESTKELKKAKAEFENIHTITNDTVEDKSDKTSKEVKELV